MQHSQTDTHENGENKENVKTANKGNYHNSITDTSEIFGGNFSSSFKTYK